MSAPEKIVGSDDAPPYVIFLGDRVLLEIVAEIEAALAVHDRELFQSHGALVWRSPHGIVKADAAFLRLRAMRVACFIMADQRSARFKFVDPPMKYFSALLHKGEWSFPHVDAARS